MQPDTIIPGEKNPQAWNRYSYTYNNPIRFNDPDGHCPICATAVIGAALGAIVGAVAYTVANHGQSFSTSELLVAAGGGAVAGALIGSGVGLLAAATTTATVASTAVSLISAGTAATVTGGSYIAQNKGKFESKPFVVNTAISATAAYLTSNPSTSGLSRLLIREAAAEATYLFNTQNPNLKDATSVAAGALIAHGTSEFLNGIVSPTIKDEFMPSGNYYGQNVYPGLGVGNSALRVAVNQRYRDSILRSILGISNGVIVSGMNIKSRQIATEILAK